MEIKPYVRYASHHVWLDTYWLNRTIWDHEFIFIEHGSLKIIVKDKEYIAKENDIVILRPNIDHYIGWNGENCSQPHVHFDFIKQEDSEEIPVSKTLKSLMTKKELALFREDFFETNNIEIPLIIHLSNPTSAKNLLFKIIEEFESQRPFKEIELQGLMTQFITLVLRENENIKETDDVSKRLNSVVVFMGENADKNLSLDEIAEEFKISSWSLIQMFNKYYGCSPIKYYNKIKLLRAVDYLKYSFYTISEISVKMGFNDPQTFSRWFKNMDGNYPSFYRKK